MGGLFAAPVAMASRPQRYHRGAEILPVQRTALTVSAVYVDGSEVVRTQAGRCDVDEDGVELPLDYAVEMNRLIQIQMEGSVG